MNQMGPCELHCESIEALPTAHSLSRNDPVMTALRQPMTDRHSNAESRTEHRDDPCRWATAELCSNVTVAAPKVDKS